MKHSYSINRDFGTIKKMVPFPYCKLFLKVIYYIHRQGNTYSDSERQYSNGAS
ncbi:gp46 [Listeria phage P40]|uniref:gp46 n=1 Tax=Listeria phage P40 TaxID=560178 RepID=UPI00018198FB|nr:gp46 [Listeria phage P40]ACI00406.1 gp46 [Listeria phage P40]